MQGGGEGGYLAGAGWPAAFLALWGLWRLVELVVCECECECECVCERE